MKKILPILFFVLILSGLAWAEWNPDGFQRWQDSEVDTLFQQRIGGVIANYPEPNGGDTTWHGIENDFLLSGDTLAYNLKDIIKTAVRPNGTSIVKVTWNDVDYIVTQKMIKLIWLKTDTWGWVDVIDSVVWSNPSIDSNIIHWTNIFPAVDYRIQKTNSTVAHRIFFKKAFLDSAVTLYNQRLDSLTIALGNVIEYDLLNVDDPDSAMDVDMRILKRLGRYVFQLSEQKVHFPGSDTMPELVVRQRWLKQGGKLYCVEYVMMWRIKQIHEAYPDAVIWHDDVTVISGTINIDDAFFQVEYPNDNFGVRVELYTAPNWRTLIRVKNVASELGADATISACICSLYCQTNAADGTISSYRVFKPWIEGQQDAATCVDSGVTWNDWNCTDYEWGTVGCGAAYDTGHDNSGDGANSDRKATAEGSTNVTTSTTWYGWSVSAALAQGWYDETIVENGVILLDPDASYNLFHPTESSSPSLRPFWTFTYTTGAAEITGRRRKIIQNLYQGE